MRNLARLTNAANRIEAWREWLELAGRYPDLAQQYAPPHDAGWRTVDKQTNKLRQAAAERQSQMTTQEYLNLGRADAHAHDAAIIASLAHLPRLVPEWECDGQPCYACRSPLTGETYTGSSSREAFARELEAEEVWLRHNAPSHPDIEWSTTQ